MKKTKSLTKTFMVALFAFAVLFAGMAFVLPQKTTSVYAATVSGTTITNFGTYNSKAMSWDIIGYVQTDGSVGSTATNTALILSHDIIAEMEFAEGMGNCSWANSDIRTWLNGDFLDSFTTAEQTAILKSTMQVESSATSYTANASGDSCFLLSSTDVFTSNLLGSKESDRIKKCSGENTSWWLRTPDNYGDGGRIVDLNGDSTSIYCDNNGGVVPAMFVDLTKLGDSGNGGGTQGGGSTPGAGVYFNSTPWIISGSVALVAGIVGLVLLARKRNNKDVY